ncbi:MAG TPA: pyridoxal-phosphate dependent enzyme [Gemmatimonadaceae bacterium]|nr:pyridoxal-phosphate dependent enzyme [Gemmatimonadaceae bacterium]
MNGGAALARLDALSAEPLFAGVTALDEAHRLRDALGPNAPRILVKRDDAIPFGFGGNKVRKLCLVAAEARACGADTLITVGGVQSNHMRATAAAATRLGLRCILVANGEPPAAPRANALLDALLGAELHYVASRQDRAPTMRQIAAELRAAGRVPYEVPLGASTPLGAAAFARAVGELIAQLPSGVVPDAIIHASSSGGTQAGLTTGCALHGLPTSVVGISADDPASSIEDEVRRIIVGLGTMLDMDGDALARAVHVTADDSFVGEGYGIATPASREAQSLAARTEALFVDHTYTAKALAALIGFVRAGRYRKDQTIVFWHTGGQVGLFA